MSRFEDLTVSKLRCTHAVQMDSSLRVRGVPVGPLVGGNAYWVDSGSTATADGSFSKPDTTLDAAFARCTADQGDIIYVKEKHSETITGAGGITADVAGVSVVGLGTGGQRPTFLMDAATTVTFIITGNDTYVENLVFNSGYADVVQCIDIDTATGVHLHNLEFGDNIATENFLTPIKAGTATDNQCDGLKVTNCRWRSTDASSVEFIEITGNTNDLVVTGNMVSHNGNTLSPLIVVTAGDSLFDAFISNNHIRNSDAAGAVLIVSGDQTDNTGFITRNLCGGLDTAGELIGAADSGFYMLENYSTSVLAASGYLLPTADS